MFTLRKHAHASVKHGTRFTIHFRIEGPLVYWDKNLNSQAEGRYLAEPVGSEIYEKRAINDTQSVTIVARK